MTATNGPSAGLASAPGATAAYALGSNPGESDRLRRSVADERSRDVR
jgi:hypothetical protein